jgi:hypothetical protein
MPCDSRWRSRRQATECADEAEGITDQAKVTANSMSKRRGRSTSRPQRRAKVWRGLRSSLKLSIIIFGDWMIPVSAAVAEHINHAAHGRLRALSCAGIHALLHYNNSNLSGSHPGCR